MSAQFHNPYNSSHVINILFEKDEPICDLVNGRKSGMPIYKNITVVVTENRYILSL